MTRPRRLIWCDSHNPGIPKPAIMLSNAIGSTPVTSSVTTPTAMAQTIWEAANITGAAVERYPAHTSRWRISPIRVSLRGRIRQIRSARALGSSVRPTGARRENPSGYPALRGQHAKLTTDAEAVPGHAGKIVEHFGQVAAGLPLCQHGDGKEPDVHQRDTGGERPQHLRERQTIVVLFVERPEFRGHRIGHLVSYHGQRARKRMSRAEGASHQADGVRKLLFE